MNTKQQEYELKLDSLFMELKSEIIKRMKESHINSDLENEWEWYMISSLKGKLIEKKKHGLNLMAMVCNEIILKC